jgi:putative membrane protein
MWYGSGWMLGMHFLWWIFWILLVVVLVVLLLRQPAGPPPASSQPAALEILKRRYAAGEISTEEFEKRKELLQRN